MSASERPIIEGILKKQATKSKRNWKDRYFRLFSGELRYYKRKDDATERGVMPITSEHYVSDVQDGKLGAKNVFMISDFLTSYYIAAGSVELKTFWMHAVARIISKLQEKEDWYGVRGLNVDRSASQIQLDYESRLEAYKKSQGITDDATVAEEDAVVARLAADEAKKAQEAARLEEQELMREKEQIQKEKMDEMIREKKEKMRDVEKRLAEAVQMERKAQEAALRAQQLAADAEAKALEERRVAQLQPPAEDYSLMKRLSSRIKSMSKLVVSPPKQEEPVEEKKIEPKKVAGGIASRLKQWQDKMSDFEEKQSKNVFSGAYDGGAAPKPGDANYGKAVAGSATEMRAKAAAEWVDKEIDKLIQVIKKVGTVDEKGQHSVTFGVLFVTYQDISDTLVGILMRAKKRKRITYPGDMLFQGQHNSVVITVIN